MPVVSILNANIFNGHASETRPIFIFGTSPGEGETSETYADMTIDGADCTLIPGLVDAKIDADAAPWAFPQFAAAGITTVIDTSSETADTRAMRRAASQTRGWPSYFASGSAAGGRGAQAWKELHMFPYRGVELVSSPAEAERFVSKKLEGPGASGIIRVIADAPGLDDHTLCAVVDAAHRHGKFVIAHASRVESYRRALDVGCEIITPVPMDGELDSKIVNGLRDEMISVVPSLSLIRRVSIQAGYPSSAYDIAAANVNALYTAQVPICAGTSANDLKGLVFNFGDSIYEELQRLVQAGLSNTSALQAATSVPAEAFRLPDCGSIEFGKRCDPVTRLGPGQYSTGLRFNAR